MKKVVLSAAVAVLGLAGAKAQVNMESVELGVRAGYNYSTLRGDLVEKVNVNGSHGYHLGLFAEVPVTDRFSVQPEVIYSVQGAKFGEGDNNTLTLSTQNLNIPVLAKFYVADGFNLQAGPQIGVNTGATWKYEGFDVASKVDDKALGNVNFGAVVGAGYKMAEGFSVDARYNFGLTNIFDNKNKSLTDMKISDKNEFKDGVLSVGVAYSF